MTWSDRYVGIPWADRGRTRAGCDCYGLARLIYREELGIALPDYREDYASATEEAEVAALIARASVAPPWVHVEGAARPFDLAVLRGQGLATHLGIVIREGLMIHMAARDRAVVQGYAAGSWKHRLVSRLRHRDRAAGRTDEGPEAAR
jgi:cell wall-associated NlpC family hydrolase